LSNKLKLTKASNILIPTFLHCNLLQQASKHQQATRNDFSLLLSATNSSTYANIYTKFATGCAIPATHYLILGKFSFIPAKVWATLAKFWAMFGTSRANAAKNTSIFGKNRAISAYNNNAICSFSILFINKHHSLTYPLILKG
jgi:hypothetical protein